MYVALQRYTLVWDKFLDDVHCFAVSFVGFGLLAGCVIHCDAWYFWRGDNFLGYYEGGGEGEGEGGMGRSREKWREGVRDEGRAVREG